MDEPVSAPPPAPDGAAPEAVKKKKKRVRGAWISFIGRIVAQIIGAAASVVLGVLILQRVQNSADSTSPAKTNDQPQLASAPGPIAASRPDGEVAIAVLPLDNFSGDTSQDYFVNGMTEALIANLAQIDGLHVISRTSAMQYRGERKSLPTIAHELGVDLIVEGSVIRSGDRVRITAQLINAKTDAHLWAQSYDRTVRDILTLQAEVATAIGKEVRGAVAPDLTRAAAARRPIDPVVYDLYLRGRHAWNLRTSAGYEEAIKSFDQAIAKDPEFALAHAGLADTYTLMGPVPRSPNNPRASFEKARTAARRALELDPGLAEAHASLGAVYFFGDRDLDAATKEFTRALELNRHYPTAHQWFAILLAERRRDVDATQHAQEAVALDPLSGVMHQALGLVHYYAKRFTPGAAEMRRALELNPQLSLARVVLAKSLLLSGDPNTAITTLASLPDPKPVDAAMVLAAAHLRAGNRSAADKLIQDLAGRTPRPVDSLAQWSAVTGDFAAAAEHLQSRPRGAPMPAVWSVDPLLETFRADARFTAIAQAAR
jgi:TolB-like protein/Tfp pilus assembly protein PilF